jgi:hypothetical protein
MLLHHFPFQLGWRPPAKTMMNPRRTEKGGPKAHSKLTHNWKVVKHTPTKKSFGVHLEAALNLPCQPTKLTKLARTCL